MKNISTNTLLHVYFGLDNQRGIKKKDACDQLVHRGVGVRSLEHVIIDMMDVVAMTAENRIPEIDDNQGEEDV
jgi:hypothetical protein